MESPFNNLFETVKTILERPCEDCQFSVVLSDGVKYTCINKESRFFRQEVPPDFSCEKWGF